ncbi:MAG: hypothetical protein BWX48_01545 [Verrucomicrobia bacterium ADurb.Bin006]|jgi:hypothetical protein|nr:MAG: hypothetical protein BWX48_01545 [Verrucomicrobia bacterium ADurb.Bin006]
MYYCACGDQGRGIGLITSKLLDAGGAREPDARRRTRGG